MFKHSIDGEGSEETALFLMASRGQGHFLHKEDWLNRSLWEMTLVLTWFVTSVMSLLMSLRSEWLVSCFIQYKWTTQQWITGHAHFQEFVHSAFVLNIRPVTWPPLVISYFWFLGNQFFQKSKRTVLFSRHSSWFFPLLPFGQDTKKIVTHPVDLLKLFNLLTENYSQ